MSDEDMVKAIYYGKLEKVKKLISNGFKINEKVSLNNFFLNKQKKSM